MLKFTTEGWHYAHLCLFHSHFSCLFHNFKKIKKSCPYMTKGYFIYPDQRSFDQGSGHIIITMTFIKKEALQCF